MFRFALKSALGKKRRLVGTALSVTLGITFLVGTLVFTDTIQRTFDNLFAGIYEETDSYVRSSTVIELQGGAEARGRIPEDLVATVAEVDGVAEAVGFVAGFAQVVDADGDAIGNPAMGAPTLGMSSVSGPLDMWQITEGRDPGAGEVMLDRATADKADVVVGDQVTVVTMAGPRDFTVSGIAKFGSVDSPGGASVAIFDLRTAQDVLAGGVREVDAVMVNAADGVSQDELTERVAAVLPETVEAVTGATLIEETQDLMDEGLGFLSTFLLVFAAIGLVVACFTIYNTFQIIVTQRSREMALLRAVGASRPQVLGAQLLEAVIIGVTASAVGLVGGVAVSGGLKGLMEGLGFDIPAGGTVFLARTAVVGMTVGLLVTVVSAVFPALRASRIPPLAALRETRVDSTPQQSRLRLVRGAIVTALGAVGFAAGLGGSGLGWLGIGCLLVFIGAFDLGPLLARPIARVLPVDRLAGITGEIARENAMRNPKRTARTGGALMVGVALVAAITVLAATAKDWTRDVFSEQFRGDYVVNSTSIGFGGLNPDLARSLAALPEVEAAAGVRVGAMRDATRGNMLDYVSVDPSQAGRVFDLGEVRGSLADLTAEGIFVEDGTAESRDLEVGDRFLVQLLNGSTQWITVEGIYAEDDMAGDWVVSNAFHEQTGADQFDFAVYMVAAEGSDDAAVRGAIDELVAGYANAEVQSRDEYIESQAARVDQLVNLMYGLLALAVVIALFSIANSIALSIHERSRELGLLRAVGMTRHQTASSVRWEAAIVALMGTGLGILLGVSFGWALSVVLRDGGSLTAVTLPVQGLVIIVVIGVLGGVMAAMRPSWRAAHLDVLRAIASE